MFCKNLLCNVAVTDLNYALLACFSGFQTTSLENLDGCFYVYQNIIGKYFCNKIIRHKPKPRVLLEIKVFMNAFMNTPLYAKSAFSNAAGFSVELYYTISYHWFRCIPLWWSKTRGCLMFSGAKKGSISPKRSQWAQIGFCRPFEQLPLKSLLW